jgi:hypothetical protein
MTKATPDHFIDLQNAPSLLWRLERMGIDVGRRWEELADKAEARIGDTAHPLTVAHLVMALAATGREDAAERFVAALRERAADPQLWAAVNIREAVLPACEAAIAHRKGNWPRVIALLLPRREELRLLGGSNAQRDLFTQLLLDAAMEAGWRDLVADMLADEAAARTTPPAARAGYAAAARWLSAPEKGASAPRSSFRRMPVPRC